MTTATFQLSDVAELITKGTTPPRSMGGFSDFGVNYIKSESLSYTGAVDTSNLVKVSPEVHQKLKRSQLKEDDILYSIAGANLGKCGIVPPEILPANTNQAVAIIRLDKTKADVRFVSFFLRNPRFVKSVLTGVAQSAQPNVNLADIGRYELPAHELPQQKTIGEALGSLDDKIELNRRMNETLEQMARALFRDWFVDFGPTRRQMEGATDPAVIMGHAFPDEKAAELAPLFPEKLSENGLPEGWKNGRLDDWATSSPKTVKPDEVDPDTNYIGLEHMPRRSIALGEWETADKVTSNKLRFTKGQVLFGKLRPYFHKVGIAPVDGICSTDIVVVDGLSKSLVPFVATLMSSDEFVAYTNQSSTGTKMPRTSWRVMRDYQITRPPLATVEAFGEVVQPMHDKITHSIEENNTLAKMRDLLLPKLMSGEIRLKEAEHG